MNKKNNVWDNDAYGHLIWDYHKGDHDVVEIVERDDGYVDASSVLIHKYDNNGMFRFESIPTNNKRGVPFVVRKRRERKKLTKDDVPSGLKLFFCLLRCSSLTYRVGYAALLAS